MGQFDCELLEIRASRGGPATAREEGAGWGQSELPGEGDVTADRWVERGQVIRAHQGPSAVDWRQRFRGNLPGHEILNSRMWGKKAEPHLRDGQLFWTHTHTHVHKTCMHTNTVIHMHLYTIRECRQTYIHMHTTHSKTHAHNTLKDTRTNTCTSNFGGLILLTVAFRLMLGNSASLLCVPFSYCQYFYR